MAIPLSKLALSAAGNYFALMVLGLSLAIILAGSVPRRYALIIGVVMALVGADQMQPNPVPLSAYLYDGFDIAIVSMGLFGVAEILRNLETPERKAVHRSGDRQPASRPEIQRRVCRRHSSRFGARAFMIGIVPGNGATLSSFVSYALEKAISRTPEKFGKGAIQGVAGPESANNAAAQTTFIPQADARARYRPRVMALVGGAMTLHGVVPRGPQVISKHP